MPQHGNKELQVIPVSFVPTGGLDYSAGSASVPDTALRAGRNWYYPPSSSRLTVRPGFSCVTTEVNKLGAEIKKLYAHYNGSTTYLVAASGGKLYRMTKATLEGATPAWTEIGSLSGASVKPSMITFNTSLVVADNHTHLRYWDSGGTYGLLSNSPGNSTALIHGGNRVIANSQAAGGLDGVYYSATEDETTWMGSGTSLVVRAGYGDAMRVNALHMFGDNLIVSKSAVDGGDKKLFRIDMSGGSSDWEARDLVQNRAAQTAHGMFSAWGDMLFFDDSGLYSLKGVQEYGDIEPYLAGRKINSLLSQNNTLDIEEFAYVPSIGAIVMVLDGASSIFVISQGLDEDGDTEYKFLRWTIKDTVISSVATVGDYTYFGTVDGRLLKLDFDTTTDEISYGSEVYYTATARSKKFKFGGYAGKLQRTSVQYTPLEDGDGVLEVIYDDETTTYILKEFSVAGGGLRIGGDTATTELIGGTYATGTRIGATATATGSEFTRQRARDSGLMFQVRISNGARVELCGINAEVSAPLGR